MPDAGSEESAADTGVIMEAIDKMKRCTDKSPYTLSSRICSKKMLKKYFSNWSPRNFNLIFAGPANGVDQMLAADNGLTQATDTGKVSLPHWWVKEAENGEQEEDMDKLIERRQMLVETSQPWALEWSRTPYTRWRATLVRVRKYCQELSAENCWKYFWIAFQNNFMQYLKDPVMVAKKNWPLTMFYSSPRHW